METQTRRARSHSQRRSRHRSQPAAEQAQRSPLRQWLVEIERGISQSLRGGSTLFGHFFAALIVLTTGLVIGIGVLQWAIVLLAFSVSVSAEMFQMVLRSLWNDLNDQLSEPTRKALQIGCVAVVVTRLGSMIAVGLIYANAIANIW